jgi:hypothetical protein
MLRSLVHHDDAVVRRITIAGTRSISQSDRLLAVELVTSVRLSDSKDVAEEVFSAFGRHGFLSWSDLDSRQARQLTEQLRQCPSISDYQIQDFLSSMSVESPDMVLRLLMDRAELSESGRRRDEYDPLPLTWHKPLELRSHRQFAKFLRSVRDWIAAGLGSWQRERLGAEIFRAVAQQFDDEVIQVLDECLGVGTGEQVGAVAAILHEAPRTLIWTEVEFVSRALNAASRLGDEFVKSIGGSLHAAVSTGTRTGIPGQPFAEDVEQRDRSAAIAAKLPAGSIERLFYESLVASAEQKIKWEARHDEQLQDGRDW